MPGNLAGEEYPLGNKRFFQDAKMTQLECARNNRFTFLMRKLASLEGINPALLLKQVKEGKAVIPHNRNHTLKKPCANSSN